MLPILLSSNPTLLLLVKGDTLRLILSITYFFQLGCIAVSGSIRLLMYFAVIVVRKFLSLKLFFTDVWRTLLLSKLNLTSNSNSSIVCVRALIFFVGRKFE